MKKFNQQKGFTLVELAIVLTIIGLLIGGILKGQQLIQNTRVTTTAQQVQAIDAAVTTFRDTYNFIPGDLVSPNTRLPNYNAAAVPTDGALGDNIVGPAAMWTLLVAPNSAQTSESEAFFNQLSAADLLNGVSYRGAATYPTVAWGATHPAARVGGGFVVATPQAAAVQAGAAAGVGTRLAGIVLGLVNTPTTVPNAAAATLLTPSQASVLDGRLDDGAPLTGNVQFYGAGGAVGGAFCISPAAAAASTYNTAQGSKSCGLMIAIQG